MVMGITGIGDQADVVEARIEPAAYSRCRAVLTSHSGLELRETRGLISDARGRRRAVRQGDGIPRTVSRQCAAERAHVTDVGGHVVADRVLNAHAELMD